MNTNTKKHKTSPSGLKAEEINHPFIKKGYRKFSDIFAKRLANTEVTPNQVTVTGFLVTALSAYFFFIGDYLSLIIAATLLQISYLLDYIDGSLARIKNSTSTYGEWLDKISGIYGWVLIYTGATFGVYNRIHEPYILIFGFSAMVGTLIKNHTQDVYLTKFKFAGKFGQEVYKRLGAFMFLRPTGPLIYTLFTIGALLNQIYWILIIFGIYTPLYTVLQNVIFTLKIKKSLKKEKE